MDWRVLNPARCSENSQFPLMLSEDVFWNPAIGVGGRRLQTVSSVRAAIRSGERSGRNPSVL